MSEMNHVNDDALVFMDELSDDQLKVAIDDARARQAALLQSIYFNDQQALRLLRLYVTLGLAAAAGAISSGAPCQTVKPHLSLPPLGGVQ